MGDIGRLLIGSFRVARAKKQIVAYLFLVPLCDLGLSGFQ